MMLERLTLPADLVVIRIEELSPSMQDELSADEGDVVLTRPRHRRRSIVVDAGTAGLLENFRQPTTIPEAVLVHAIRTEGDPEAVLADCYPVLRRLRESGFLVRAEDAELSASMPLLSPGDRLGQWRVERSLQVFDDSDVYRVSGPDDVAAVKVARPGSGQRLRGLLSRERDVLRLLEERGQPAPRVTAEALEEGSDPAWLALSWVPGRRADAVAGELRRRVGPASVEGFRLCAAVATAYAELHRHGVLHGDVHPGNLLVDDSHPRPVVQLVDFAMASVVDGTGPGISRQRAGIGWAFEPELAASALSGKGDVPVTAAGEQYSVATVCFHMLTGRHHLDLPVERQSMFARILEGRPHRLSDVVGVAGLDLADEALQRAMSLRPEDRFTDLAELAAAFEAQADRLAARSSRPGAGRTEPLVERLAQPRTIAEFARQATPRSTVCYGAAGVALGLMRLAQLRQDPELLDAAERWSLLAATPQPGDEARYNPRFQITAATVTPESLYHSETGIRWAEALVAHAAGDGERTLRSTRRFLRLVDRPAPVTELINGEAGRVVAATLLLPALGSPAVSEARNAVRQWLVARLPELANRVTKELTGEPMLGLAHGVSGGVLAVILGQRALAEPASHVARELTARLLDQIEARPIGRWRTMPGLEHSWCNGTAGVALVLAAASRHTGDATASRAAERLGAHAAEFRGRNWSFCCGSAGVGLVLANLARILDQPRWLEPAREQAMLASTRAHLGEPHAHSLHKGVLAACVLAEELEHPDRIAFPSLIAETAWT